MWLILGALCRRITAPQVSLEVSAFSVLQEVECSDHAPITFMCEFKDISHDDSVQNATSSLPTGVNLDFANEINMKFVSQEKLQAVFEEDKGGIRTRVGGLVSASTQAFPEGNLRIDSLAGGLAELLVDASLLAGATSTPSGLGGVATRNRNTCKKKMWFDKRLKKEKKELNRIFKKFGKFSSRYKNARHRFRTLCVRKKEDFEKRLTLQLEAMKDENPQKFWELLRLGHEGRKGNPPNDISLSDWLKHFRSLASLPQDRATANEECIEQREEELTTNDPSPPFCFDLPRRLTRTQIGSAIQKLKSRKAAGLDGICNELINWSSPWIIDVLLALFLQEILASTYFPDMWNITAVKPLYKSDDPNDTNNYRGISLLPCLGKLFCLVINEIVMHNLESAGLSESVLSLFQGGFRRRRGCREQSLVLLASILSSKRRKKHAMCAFIDFSKAYDTVQHEKLWATLSAANMGPKILNILKELYRKTSCTVKSEEGQFSEFYEYLVGVRQGCVLSPAIFNLFINSLANLIKEHEELLSGINIGDLVIFVLLYADDVVLLAPSRQELQKLLTLLQSFCEDSGMRVNLKKSKVVIFKAPPTKNTVPATALKFYDSVVEEVSFYKIWEIYMTKKYCFNNMWNMPF